MAKKNLLYVCAMLTFCLITSIRAVGSTIFSDNFDAGVSGSVWEAVPATNTFILVGDSAHKFGAQSAKQVNADPFIYNMRTILGAIPNPGPITAGNKEVASVMFWDDLNTSPTPFGGTIMLAKDGLSDFYQLGVNSAVSVNNYYMRTLNDGNLASSVVRTQGWHELRIEVGPYTGNFGDVLFYIDNNLVSNPATFGKRKANTGSGFDLNEIRLGLSVKTPGSAFWYDNVSLDVVPEPTSIGLLGIGLVAIPSWRRRLQRGRCA
jgi:hypothetical protein